MMISILYSLKHNIITNILSELSIAIPMLGFQLNKCLSMFLFELLKVLGSLHNK